MTDPLLPDATEDRGPKSAEISSGTPELRALLVGYADALEAISNLPTVLWIRPEKRPLLRWLRLPAPRRLVQAFFVRHLHRSIGALKSGVVRRGALSVEVAAQQRDREMLEQFEESLPSKMRLALIWPLGLLGVLSVAYVLAALIEAGDSTFLGDLATAAVNLDRTAALAAVQHAHRVVAVTHGTEVVLYAGAAMIVSWSAALVILLLLPAFIVGRQARARLTGLEARAFAASGAPAVHEIELDVIAGLLLLLPVGVLGVALLSPLGEVTGPVGRVAGVVCTALTVLAGVELRAKYAERRSGVRRRHRFITRVSPSLAGTLSLVIFVALSFSLRQKEPDTWSLQVADRPMQGKELPNGWIYEIHFMVTAIQQNAECHDTHSPLIDDPQFLRFDLETWSTVDQFADPAVAYELTLHHWSVQDSRGNVTGNLFMHATCGRGTEAISQPITPGAHTKTVVVVSAPKSAAFLRLEIPSYHAVWKWRIPPTKG